MGQPKTKEQEMPVYHDLRLFADNEKSPVFHGFFGRRGGVSTDVYDSLNCGFGSEDHPDHVHKNRDIVASEVGLSADQILTLYQSHGNVCLQAEQSWPAQDAPAADAMVTKTPGLALGILTADCVPVLFYGPGDEPVVGAAHAGWKGAFEGILDSTIDEMEKLGANRTDIRACIGPCIGKASYEVSDEFFQQYIKQDEENEKFFRAGQKEGHPLFDLAGYCAFKLYRLGLTRVYIKDLDTYFNEADFFSYRRATHRGEKDYGRQISLIFIKP